VTEHQDGHEPGQDPGGPEVGSLAEEATKLFGALSGWASEHGGDAGQAAAGFASHAADAAKGIDDHIATGAAECRWCPVCRTIHAVRELSPEVKDHLATAAASLMQAAAGVLATAVPEQGTPRRSDGVEKIDLDDEWPEEDR
jgi:hypothetical protein